jgi:hypothetical protein
VNGLVALGFLQHEFHERVASWVHTLASRGVPEQESFPEGNIAALSLAAPAIIEHHSENWRLCFLTERTGYIGDTFGPKGLSRGCSFFCSRSMYPRSYSIKLTSQIPSSTSLIPTA